MSGQWQRHPAADARAPRSCARPAATCRPARRIRRRCRCPRTSSSSSHSTTSARSVAERGLGVGRGRRARPRAGPVCGPASPPGPDVSTAGQPGIARRSAPPVAGAAALGRLGGVGPCEAAIQSSGASFAPPLVHDGLRRATAGHVVTPRRRPPRGGTRPHPPRRRSPARAHFFGRARSAWSRTTGLPAIDRASCPRLASIACSTPRPSTRQLRRNVSTVEGVAARCRRSGRRPGRSRRSGRATLHAQAFQAVRAQRRDLGLGRGGRVVKLNWLVRWVSCATRGQSAPARRARSSIFSSEPARNAPRSSAAGSSCVALGVLPVHLGAAAVLGGDRRPVEGPEVAEEAAAIGAVDRQLQREHVRAAPPGPRRTRPGCRRGRRSCRGPRLSSRGERRAGSPTSAPS